MLLHFTLDFFQPIAALVWSGWMLPQASATLPQVPPPARVQSAVAEDGRVAALRRSLFRTSKPALLSHDLPVPEGMEAPAVVMVVSVPDRALRELGAQPAAFTPYDAYNAVVRSVLRRARGDHSSLADASRALRVAHAFRYTVRDPYRADLPSVTAAHQSGDCKSKALWLYDQLGDRTALYVIGKIDKRARASHAWLYWRYEDRWWILDPTNLSTPIAADSVSSKRYVPYYSFATSGAYRHPATHLLMTANLPAVAAKRR